MEGICIAWLAGIAWQLYQAQLWPSSLYVVTGSIAFIFLTLWVCRSRFGVEGGTLTRVPIGYMRIVLWIFVGLTGFAWAGWLGNQKLVQVLSPELEQKDIRVVGYIDALPQEQLGRWRFTLVVEQADQNGQVVSLPPRLMLNWYSKALDVLDNKTGEVPYPRVGQRWALDVRLKAPHGSMNPHGFDYELWLWEQGIGAVGYVRDGKTAQAPELLGVASRHGMEHWRETVRDSIMQTVPNAKQAGLLAALTLGDQRAINRVDWQTFRFTGVAHLVSISGLHITMMAWLAYGVIGWLWRRSVRLMLWVPAHMAALAGGLVCAVLYAWFAGWGIPAQRTVLMLATVVVLRFLGGRWPWYSVWLWVACMVVAVDPWAFLQAGFWLSFVAVGVLLSQTLRKAGQKENDVLPLLSLPDELVMPLWRRWLCSIRHSAYQMLQVQWCISIALAPLTLLLFQQVSIAGLIANLFAIPWVTFVMVPLSLLGVLFHPLWHAAAWAAQVLMIILEWLASSPWAVWESVVPPWPIAFMAVIGAIVLVLPVVRWRYRLLGLLVVVPAVMWQPTKPGVGQFEVLALDVGQGNAVLIRTATHALLYDTGPKYNSESDAGVVLVVPTLRALGVKLDRVVVSHSDADHSGGLISVLAAHPQADLMISAKSDDGLWSVQSVDKLSCVAGTQWEWDGVQFAVLYPFSSDMQEVQSDQGSQGVGVTSPNALSCVLRISSQNGEARVAALLTGDIESAQEQALLTRYGSQGLQSNWLLVPHHGSKTSSSKQFLAAVAAEVAVAQAGYLNRFGHPAIDVVTRYRQQNTQFVNTAYCGAASWRSSVPSQIVCQRDVQKHYWHHVGEVGAETVP